jgi:hypothetical protein
METLHLKLKRDASYTSNVCYKMTKTLPEVKSILYEINFIAVKCRAVQWSRVEFPK